MHRRALEPLPKVTVPVNWMPASGAKGQPASSGGGAQLEVRLRERVRSEIAQIGMGQRLCAREPVETPIDREQPRERRVGVARVEEREAGRGLSQRGGELAWSQRRPPPSRFGCEGPPA